MDYSSTKSCKWATDEERQAKVWSLIRRECDLLKSLMNTVETLEYERHTLRGTILAVQKCSTIIASKKSLRRSIDAVKREIFKQERRLAEIDQQPNNALLLALGFASRDELMNILNELELVRVYL